MSELYGLPGRLMQAVGRCEDAETSLLFFCRELRARFNCAALLADADGRVLAQDGLSHSGLLMRADRLDESLWRTILIVSKAESVPESVPESSGRGFEFDDGRGVKRYILSMPLIAYMEHMGELALLRPAPSPDSRGFTHGFTSGFTSGFTPDEAFAAEFCAYYAALIMHKMYRSGYDSKRGGRSAGDIKNSIAALSFSELEAALHILRRLNWTDGLFIAKNLSEETNVSRPVFVNALRKLAASGAIEARSLGVKGTYVRVLDSAIMRELKKYE